MNTDYPVPPSALDYLTKRLGSLETIPNAAKEAVLSAMVESRLPAHPLVDISVEERHMHSRGQSMPDWVDLRYGRVNSFPDGVAFPESDEDVRELLKYAKDAGARVLPYGGGTISHQHGVGMDHAPYMPAEKGALGMDAMRAVIRPFDTDGMMNLGKLV